MIKYLASAAILASTSTIALAQYQGPAEQSQPAENYAKTTVSAIKADPKDDAKVTLEGTLINKTGDESYTFKDDTGEILVEIDTEDFPNQPVNENTVVRIEGEVDTHLVKDVDIDAERVVIVQ